MTRALWLSDIHLNLLNPVKLEKFFSLVRASKPDMIWITGDIGEAPRLAWYLKQLEVRFQRPIYFVLGNHDYFNSSFDEVHQIIARLTAQSSFLKWMNTAGIVEIAPDTG